MESRQQFKEDRAEEAAKPAANDLEEVNRARERDVGAVGQQQQQHDQQKPGVIGSVLRAVHDTYENAKEAVVGKRDTPDLSCTREEQVGYVDAGDEGTGEVRDISAGKAKDYTTDKAGSKVGEHTDYASQKAKETKDATKEKAGEYTDYETTPILIEKTSIE